MQPSVRIEQALETAIAGADPRHAAPHLAAAMHHAVFPGGARLRPQLCLAVAEACGGDAPKLADAAAAAIELLHCASLVHDDMPCFDDAPVRRGRPSVHAAFGDQIALLAGDALIVRAFEIVAQAGAAHPHRLADLIAVIARGVGMPGGIVAGQAWEIDPEVSAKRCRCAKTGALFVAATAAGAVASGADPLSWHRLGARLGEAYQVADDLLDAAGEARESGKPVGQDIVHDRPNAVRELGLNGALDRLAMLIDRAVLAVPDCHGAEALQKLVRAQATRLVPKGLARSAA